MTDSVREQLSAFLDDELDAREVDLLVRRMDRDPALHGALDRYGLIGEILRAGPADAVLTGLGSRVRDALAVEPDPVPSVAGAGVLGKAARSLAGLAVAASVAVVAVLALRSETGENPEPARIVATTPASTDASDGPMYTVPPPRFAGAQTIPEDMRLTRFMLQHAAATRSRGTLTYRNMVTDQQPLPAAEDSRR